MLISISVRLIPLYFFYLYVLYCMKAEIFVTEFIVLMQYPRRQETTWDMMFHDENFFKAPFPRE